MIHNRPCLCLKQESVNKAVYRCCQARNRALADCKGLNIGELKSAYLGAEAYLATLPSLNTAQDVKDYMACINHAVAINIIKPYEAPPLLAAARITLNLIRGEENHQIASERLAQGKEKIAISRSREERQQAKLLLKQQPPTAA